MPITYRFDTKLVVIEMVGEYSMDDIRTTIISSLADSGRPANSFLMINLGESRSIYNRSAKDVESISHFVASLGKSFNNRVALVAPADLQYGMMRMSSIDAEEWGIKTGVFRTFDEAKKWLLS